MKSPQPLGRQSLLGLPEADVAAAAFLLNFVWEFWQVPWYRGMSDMPHLEGIYFCSRAAFGDAIITLIAYAAAGFSVGERRWPLRPSTRSIVAYLGIGLMITVLLEWLATSVLDRWEYGESMPTLPILDTGLAPLLQWLVLPLAVLGIVRHLWARES